MGNPFGQERVPHALSKELALTEEQDMAIAIDPICKMEVDTENPSGGQSEYQGTSYYFCAPGCKVAFDKEPEKYLSDQPAAKPGFFSRIFGHKH